MPSPTGTDSARGVADHFAAAVARLSADALIAYPTETVWGLGACADRPLAIERLLAWKGRRDDQPLAVLVRSAESAHRLGCRLNEYAALLAERFWPGPLMIVVPCEAEFAPGVARPDGALGLRCSNHPVASALADALDDAGLGPLTSTSLNRAGDLPAIDFDEARALLRDSERQGVEAPLLCAGLPSGEVFDAGAARPSTVVDCTGETPKILRAGEIDADLLSRVWA